MGLTWGLFVAVGILVAVAAALAVAEAALLRVSPVRLEVLAEGGDRRAGRALRLVDDIEGTLYAVLLAVLLVQIGAATLMGVATQRWLGNTGATVGSVLLALVLFVYAEAIPKTFAVRNATASASAVAGPVSVLKALLRPVTRVLVVIADRQSPGPGLTTRQVVSEEELRRLAGDAAGAGEIDEADLALVERAFEFGDRTVADILVPRPDVVSVPASISAEEVLARAVQTGHRRLVVDAGGLDDIVGVVWLLDVVAAVTAGDRTTAATLAREPLCVPEPMSVSALLGEMQAAAERFAVVVDEYGGTAGIVTIEDVVSELVGEIAEPGTAREPFVERLAGGGWVVDGRLALPEASELIGVELPGRGYHTLAGLITTAAGAIPEVGEGVTVAGHHFVVIDAGRLRIRRVRITPVEAAGEDGDG
jgi:CBS domain containing-hemolysin-like protein